MNRGPISGAPWLDEPCERHEQQDCRECADERYQETIWTVAHVSSKPCRIQLDSPAMLAIIDKFGHYESLSGDELVPSVGARVRLHEHDGVVDLYQDQGCMEGGVL